MPPIPLLIFLGTLALIFTPFGLYYLFERYVWNGGISRECGTPWTPLGMGSDMGGDYCRCQCGERHTMTFGYEFRPYIASARAPRKMR